jgi:hypothetical protein
MSPVSDLAVPMQQSLNALLALPRSEQPAAVEALCSKLPAAQDEPWNTAFGPTSLYHAFTQCTVAQNLHAANRAMLRPRLDARPGFRVIEVGGGNGALWDGLLRADDHGTIVVVDPHPNGADGIRRVVPSGVTVEHIQSPVEDAALPDADGVVCSLVLHHIAGADQAQRAGVGLSGNGKLEALEHLRGALALRNGWMVLNEADIYCDLGLAPGDPLLIDRLLDSYVRRCAVAIAEDLRTRTDADAALKARWVQILRDWSLAQVALAGNASYAARDVYELDVVSWLALLNRAGLTVESRRFTDRWMLFHQYVLTA